MKKLFALLAAVLMIFSLAGCAKSNEPVDTGSTEGDVVKLEGLELQFVPSKDADVIIAGTEGLPELLSAALLAFIRGILCIL